MKLREKTTATLLIAIFMISAFTVAIPVSATVTTWYVDDTGPNDPGTGTFSDPFRTILLAITAATADDTIIVAEGTYDEQVVIGVSLTLEGAGDTTIIQPSGQDHGSGPELTATTSIPWIGGGTGLMSAIVSVETAGEVVIKDLKIDGSLITSKSTLWQGGLVYLETSGKVEGVTVIGNPVLPDRTAGIFGAAITESTSLEVTGCSVIGYNRAGIYALGGTITADYHHNEINGPGVISTGVPNGMFFLEGAKGSATYNIVTDLGYIGEEYRSTGIGTYDAGTGIIFAYNEISYVQNAFALSTDTIGTIVEYNDIHDCHTGVRIEADATDSIIQYNDIYDNDFAMRCGPEMGEGNKAHYNNFVNNLGLEWTNVGEGCTYIGAVCNRHITYELNAINNWWGYADGPGVVGDGSGDTVSSNVLFVPWLDSMVIESSSVGITGAADGWELDVSVLGSGSVTRTCAPTDYFVDPEYVNSAVVTLDAEPEVNWQFEKWTGALTGSADPDTITMDGNKAVIANFVLNVISISVSPTSIDFGTVIMGKVSDPPVEITVSNNGNVAVEIDASVIEGEPAFYETYLRIGGAGVGAWSDTEVTVDDGLSTGLQLTLDLELCREVGAREGMLVFWAEEA